MKRTLSNERVVIIVMQESLPEIARRLGVAEGTVKSPLHRALTALRLLLSEEKDLRCTA